MLKNKYLWLFFVLLISSTVWVSWSALKQIYTYNTLTSHAQADKISFTIIAINDEKYHLKGNYEFRVLDKIYNGESILNETYYKNPWAAEKNLPEATKKTWNVWYSNKNPALNSLERIFPVKETIYTLIIWALTIYFVGLVLYVTKKQSLER